MGAVDKRVVGIIPIVMDLLNISPVGWAVGGAVGGVVEGAVGGAVGGAAQRVKTEWVRCCMGLVLCRIYTTSGSPWEDGPLPSKTTTR